MRKIRVLVVEDSIYWVDLNVRELKRFGFLVEHKAVACKKAMQRTLEQENWDIIISDHNMQNFNALQALELRNTLCKGTPFVIVSEDVPQYDLEKALIEGCCDYINKENLGKLGPCVEGIIEAAICQ
jgi:CheY-like chemotaxis protein